MIEFFHSAAIASPLHMSAAEASAASILSMHDRGFKRLFSRELLRNESMRLFVYIQILSQISLVTGLFYFLNK